MHDGPHDDSHDNSPDESHDEAHDFHDDFVADDVAADEFAEETPRGATRANSRDGTNGNSSARGSRPGPVRKQPAARTDAQRTPSPHGPNPSLKGLKLTTAAALQAGTNEPPELRSGFLVGMQVRHPRYGLGTVVDVSGMSRRRTVTVDFVADNRRECFVEAKCPLQPVGLR